MYTDLYCVMRFLKIVIQFVSVHNSIQFNSFFTYLRAQLHSQG
jgi:hypothetical protein